MSSFWTYIVGFGILIVGLNLAAWQFKAPPAWMVIGSVVLLGIGVLSAVSSTKTKDPPAT